ncbi:MAG: hypothetical protein RL681_142 [Candidatus Parcubacteria bacterium]|jgi:Tfp pilus assembly protein FimT
MKPAVSLARRGTTIIELAIAMGIMVLLSVLVILSLSGWRNRAGLDSATKQITVLLREAQSRSMTRASGVAWGVHFDNTASSTPFYALFSVSYSTSTAQKRTLLPTGVHFSNTSVPEGTSLNITFAELTGIPSTSTVIMLEFGGSGGGGGAASISRAASGLLFFDDFNRASL